MSRTCNSSLPIGIAYYIFYVCPSPKTNRHLVYFFFYWCTRRYCSCIDKSQFCCICVSSGKIPMLIYSYSGIGALLYVMANNLPLPPPLSSIFPSLSIHSCLSRHYSSFTLKGRLMTNCNTFWKWRHFCNSFDYKQWTEKNKYMYYKFYAFTLGLKSKSVMYPDICLSRRCILWLQNTDTSDFTSENMHSFTWTKQNPTLKWKKDKQ